MGCPARRLGVYAPCEMAVGRDRKQIWRAMLLAGAAALVAGTSTPFIAADDRAECGWTCYSPAGSGYTPPRTVSATDLWHLRPLLAAAMLAAAMMAIAAGALGRGRAAAAVAAAAVTVLVVIDALTADGIRWLVQSGYAYKVQPSPWTLLPVAGGALLCFVLLRDSRPTRASPKRAASGGGVESAATPTP